MVSIIADPKRYDDGLVVVIGFLTDETENTAIYLTKEFAGITLVDNAVSLVVRRDDRGLAATIAKLKGQYVLVEGRFHAPKDGFVKTFAGNLTSISRVVGIQAIRNH